MSKAPTLAAATRRDRRVGRGDRRNLRRRRRRMASVFSIQATAGSGRADVTVIVADAKLGQRRGRAVLPDPDTPARATGGIDAPLLRPPAVRRVDPYLPPDAQRRSGRRWIRSRARRRASSTSPRRRPAAARRPRATTNTASSIALGCIDLPEGSVLPDGVVAVALPLRDTVPSPVGRFAVTSQIAFRPPLARGRLDRRSLARPQRLPAGPGPAAARLHHRRAVAGDGGRPARLLAQPGAGRRGAARRRADGPARTSDRERRRRRHQLSRRARPPGCAQPRCDRARFVRNADAAAAGHAARDRRGRRAHSGQRGAGLDAGRAGDGPPRRIHRDAYAGQRDLPAARDADATR